MKKVNKTSLLNIIFLVGILAMINAIGIRYFVRADLTSSKMYSLADASKNVVASIEDKLLVKAYFSPNIPGQYGDIERYLRDMLEDYRAFSKGHLEYEFIDPGSAEAMEKEAQSFRIPPMQVQAVAKDKMETVKVYMGIVFIYGDKKETIPSVTSISNLEYEITSLIYRLTIPNQPILGIASTGTEQEKESMQVLYESLGRMYDVRPVGLDEPIDPAFDGVLVLSPRQPFTEWQLFNLDQYIIGGGKVGMFMNSYRASLQNQQAAPYNLGINEFLHNYGLGLGEDMVIDTQANMVEITSRQGFFNVRQPVRFPFLPIINDLNRENIITRQLQAVGTIFPSSVDTTYAVEKGYDVDVLLHSSEMSGRRTGPYIFMNPQQPMTRQDFQESHIPLAAIVRGKFTSYFAETGPPKKPVEKNPDAGNKDVADSGPAFEEYDGPFVKEASTENRLLLVGDGNMVLDKYAQRPNDLLFVQNCADWLLQSEDLISIRSKQIPMKPLTWNGGQVPDSIRNLTKWANRIGPVILVIILGIVLWQMRRVRNKALSEV
ncbi:MAG: GldG family protein [Candidatus Latescibacteria bacterium]|nr:GldG family protein [Candidatus Latescibacterota bacterium]